MLNNDSLREDKEIAKIEVVYVYELAHKIHNHLIDAWNWSWTNWRVDLTINFE